MTAARVSLARRPGSWAVPGLCTAREVSARASKRVRDGHESRESSKLARPTMSATQLQDGMSVVGKCAAEKAEWAISKFDETAVVC